MGALYLQEQAAPSTPPALQSVLYFKSDGLLYWKDKNGVEYQVSTGGGTISSLTNSLSSDVNLNNTASYFDGPSVAQGTVGTWFASGTVTLIDTGASSGFFLKLWDGTNVLASASQIGAIANGYLTVALSGQIASPTGNIRISVRDSSSTGGKILFNQSGNSKDSTVTVFRLA